MGRDSIIRTKMKNLKNWSCRQFHVSNNEKEVEEAALSFRHVQYLYSEDELFHFMDL